MLAFNVILYQTYPEKALAADDLTADVSDRLCPCKNKNKLPENHDASDNQK